MHSTQNRTFCEITWRSSTNMPIHVTPIPTTTNYATPAVGLAVAAAAGSNPTVIRSDSTILAFDTTIPSTLELGHTATPGVQNIAARRDHTHGTVDKLLRVVTGSYSGDAAADQDIVGLGIIPSYIAIVKRSTGGGEEFMFQTWASIVDDNAAGMGYIWGSPLVHGALVTDHQTTCGHSMPTDSRSGMTRLRRR